MIDQPKKKIELRKQKLSISEELKKTSSNIEIKQYECILLRRYAD